MPRDAVSRTANVGTVEKNAVGTGSEIPEPLRPSIQMNEYVKFIFPGLSNQMKSNLIFYFIKLSDLLYDQHDHHENKKRVIKILFYFQ